MSTKKRRPKRFVREGDTFERLKVLGLDHERTVYGKRFFRCECRCGKTLTVFGPSLTSGNTGSCGCLHSEISRAIGLKKATHGESRHYKQSKLYRTYENILKRCYNTKAHSYPEYGGRGILMCARWKRDRKTFFADMGAPQPNQSIDRLDTEGGYWCGKDACPECGPLKRVPNCWWQTQLDQASNKRNNRRITHNGRTRTLLQWSRETGISWQNIQSRIDALGWDVGRALTEPVHEATRYEHDGQSLTLLEWAAKTGISATTIAQRIRKLNWTVAKAVTAPVQSRPRKQTP